MYDNVDERIRVWMIVYINNPMLNEEKSFIPMLVKKPNNSVCKTGWWLVIITFLSIKFTYPEYLLSIPKYCSNWKLGSGDKMPG